MILLIDTCGPTGFLALVDEAEQHARRFAQTIPGRETQERLMDALGELFIEAAIAPADLACIAVVSGPGSFTGVRIGVAAAKGLAEAFQVPLVALSRLAVLAEAARFQITANIVTAWLDAGRSDVYSATFDLSTSPATVVDAEAMLPREAARQAASAAIVVEDPALHPGAIPLDAENVQAGAASLATTAFHNCAFADAALLDANYLRVPDAEIALRVRLAAAAQP